jgi:hypothetical protein
MFFRDSITESDLTKTIAVMIPARRKDAKTERRLRDKKLS